VNLEWLLSQVSSYVTRFYRALVSPEKLLASNEASTDKDIRGNDFSRLIRQHRGGWI